MLLGRLVAFRLLNAAILQTSFNPDEQWQSLEVAHRWVFGYGHLTWEWEPCIALRSVIHPGIFAAFYFMLYKLHVDTAWLIAYGPRLLQGCLAARADLAVYRSARHVGGDRIARIALAMQLGNWFLFHCMPRTFSNSLEAVFTASAIEAWIQGDQLNKYKALLLGSLCVAMRPSAGPYWLALVMSASIARLCVRKGSLLVCIWSICSELILPGLVIVTLVVCCSTLSDSLWYGQFVIVAWNFFSFNVLEGGSAWFGSHAWYWYLTEGLAVVLGTFLPFAAYGAVLAMKGRCKSAALRGPLFATAVCIATLSLAAHKEHRFLLPFVPLCSILAAIGYDKFTVSFHRNKLATLLLSFLPQVLAAVYFALFHQRGADAVMSHLRRLPPGQSGAFFLTPCHATPLHSYLHQDVRLDFLDCSPGRGNVRDRFFDKPLDMLPRLFPSANYSIGGFNLPSKTHLESEVEIPARKCLAPRFVVVAQDLPGVFVLWGSLLQREEALNTWLLANGFVQEAHISDGHWTEGPFGVERWPFYAIFRRRRE